MKLERARIALLAFACVAMLAIAGPARAAETAKAATPAATPAMDPATAAMMAEMEKNAAPGPDHKALEPFVGTWKAKLKSWWAPGEPQESEGKMVNTMIMGGRVLEGRYTGTFMGQPMTGLSLMGYDNAKKEYWSTWVDDMSTTMMLQTGGPMKDKTIVLTGTSEGMDGKPMQCTGTTKVVDANTHVFTMTGKVQGKDTTLMEITYTR